MNFFPEIFLLQEQDDFSLCKLIIGRANSFVLDAGELSLFNDRLGSRLAQTVLPNMLQRRARPICHVYASRKQKKTLKSFKSFCTSQRSATSVLSDQTNPFHRTDGMIHALTRFLSLSLSLQFMLP